MLGAAVGSSALSLGRARGSVVLGQSLDVGIDVRVDAAENAIAQCFRAEVLHGDVAVDPGRVRVLVQALSTSPVDVVVRVRSSATVDEPVVAVVLHSQCGQQGARRYDFLADFPAEMTVAQIPAAAQVPDAAAVAPSPIPAASPAPAVATAPAAAPAAASVRPAPAAPAARTSPVPPAVRAAPRRPPKRAVQAPAGRAAAATPAARAPSTRAAGSAGAGRARLTLDAPPVSAAGALRGSRALASAPTDNLPQRAEAAAAWRMLNTPPEDVLRDGQRLMALEQRELQEKQAREAREKSERELRARLERAERRLDEAESSRIDIAIVYGLIALLLLALATAAYFWNRARRSALEAAHWARAPDPAAPPTAAPQPEAVSSRPALRSSMTADLESVAGALPSAAAPRAAGAGLAAGIATVPVATAVAAAKKPADASAQRDLNPEEFFDVQQHADFFVSLGQYDQAVDVLRKHIAEYGASSPLAFLELFKLYHTLSRQSDYNALREEFQSLFNARVPNFAAFTDEGLSLEDYPAALLSIETAWGHPRVLDTIEANLVRVPGDTGKPFDMAAFSDLLMLYAVAKIALNSNGEPVAQPTGFGRSGLGALAGDSTLLPKRAAHPDFSASLTPSDPRQAVLAAAAPAMGAALSASPAAGAGAMDLELDSVPAPLSSFDHDPGLDLDLSSSQLLGAEPGDSVLDPHPTVPTMSEVDIDLPLLEGGDAPTPMQDLVAPSGPSANRPDAANNKPALDSGMIDFDLFDPNTEAQIAPKSIR